MRHLLVDTSIIFTVIDVSTLMCLVTAWRRFLTDPGSYFRRMQVG